MSRLFVVFCLLLSSCLQVQNTFQNDAQFGSVPEELNPDDPADLLLVQVREIFQKNNCVGCHATRGNSAFKAFMTYSNDDWLADSFYGVVAGDPLSSEMYLKFHRTSNCTERASDPSRAGCSVGGGCNMPSSSVSISCADEDVVIDWINALNN